MRYLAIIRHGDFTKGESKLNAKGRQQMRDLSPTLKSINPLVYCSLGPRSIESASILAKVLNTSVKQCAFFGITHSNQSNSFAESKQFLNGTTKNAVVVSRGKWANEFILYYFLAQFGNHIHSIFLERGVGVLIDCKSGDFVEIP